MKNVKLTKAADGSVYEARLRNRRLTLKRKPDGVIVDFIKTYDGFKGAESVTDGRGTRTLYPSCIVRTTPKTSALTFGLSAEAAEALLALLLNWYADTRAQRATAAETPA